MKVNASVNETLEENISYLYHECASSSPPPTLTDPEFCYTIFLLGLFAHHSDREVCVEEACPRRQLDFRHCLAAPCKNICPPFQ